MGKYTLLFNDGIRNGVLGPEAPSDDNTCNTLREAREMFRTWLKKSG